VETLIERCAGLDVHKDTVAACVRVEGPKGQRQVETRSFGTVTRELLEANTAIVAGARSLLVGNGVSWRRRRRPLRRAVSSGAGWLPRLRTATNHAPPRGRRPAAPGPARRSRGHRGGAAAMHHDLDRFFRAALAAARFRLDPGPEVARGATAAASSTPYPWLGGLVGCWRAELCTAHPAPASSWGWARSRFWWAVSASPTRCSWRCWSAARRSACGGPWAPRGATSRSSSSARRCC